jgi:hypothetical protein
LGEPPPSGFRQHDPATVAAVAEPPREITSGSPSGATHHVQ